MSLEHWLYMRPDEMFTGTVTGSVDSTYEAAWLLDGNPRRPVRGLSGSPVGGLSLSATGSAVNVGLVAVANHNIAAGVSIVIGGDLSVSLIPATWPAHDVPFGPWAQVTPTSVDNLTLTVSGNPDEPIIGELAAGTVRTVTPFRIQDAEISFEDFSPSDFAGILPFDYGRETRVIRGTQFYTSAERDVILDWWRSQRGASRLSVLIPDDDVQDAWFGTLRKPTYQKVSGDRWAMQLAFAEFPRDRW